jgi:LmbE family N-acetylglucosaminyl deacetylase/SAM-dependent methyltransferase
VVSFDASLPGTPAAEWRSDARFASLPPLELDGVTGLTVVAAHPDDESLGAGALIAQAAALGLPVRVIVVTDGGASHPGSAGARDALRRVRAAEVTAAVARLAPSARLILLDYPDGAVREHQERLAAELELLLESAHPGAIVVAPWRGDGHRDHRIVGEVVAEAVSRGPARLYEYPVWLWHWATPGSTEVPWREFVALAPTGAAAAAKSDAIAAHTSQIAPLHGAQPVLRADFLEHFAGGAEVFVGASTGTDLDAEYFERLYARNDDPWRLASRWYESRKRAVTLAALPAERYGAALEIGCSIGVLTEQLAARCDDLLALDVSEAAVQRARERLAGLSGVAVERADVAGGLPPGPYDLVVLSEVGYYFDPAGLDLLASRILQSLAEGGTVVACHWRHPVADYAQRGDDVHERLAVVLGPALTRLVRHEEEDFVLEVYCADPASVAAREGLS